MQWQSKATSGGSSSHMANLLWRKKKKIHIWILDLENLSLFFYFLWEFILPALMDCKTRVLHYVWSRVQIAARTWSRLAVCLFCPICKNEIVLLIFTSIPVCFFGTIGSVGGGWIACSVQLIQSLIGYNTNVHININEQYNKLPNLTYFLV